VALDQDFSISSAMFDARAWCLNGQPQDLAKRIQALVERKLLKLVMFDGAAGLMVQAASGPCLYLSTDRAAEDERRRNTWQLRAFIDAMEASAEATPA